jgi:hypothetical protein
VEWGERRKRKREARRWLTVRYKKGKEKRMGSNRIGGWGPLVTLAEHGNNQNNRRRFRDPFIIKLDMVHVLPCNEQNRFRRSPVWWKPGKSGRIWLNFDFQIQLNWLASRPVFLKKREKGKK